MKEIQMLSHVFWETDAEGPVDQDGAVELTKAARRQAMKVGAAALFIEREIEELVAFYLYPEASNKKTFLMSEILGSDAVSFSQKKRLIMGLVNSNDWLNGPAKAEFDKRLKDLISVRNAFAHGNVIIKDSVAYLEYFEGARRRQPLSDDYLTALELNFHALVGQLETVKTAAGLRQRK